MGGVGFDVSMAVETCFCAKRYLDYILDLYTNAISIQAKSDCADDQGELIKALARNHSVRDKLPPSTSLFINSRTLMGCTDPP